MWFTKRLVSPAALRVLAPFLPHCPDAVPQLGPRLLRHTCRCRADVAAAAGVEEADENGCEVPLDTAYSPEQRARILQLLNTASESELSGIKLLRGRKSQNLVQYREQNGPFTDLQSVTKVPLLKHKSATIVFNSILKPSSSKPFHSAKFLRPQVDRARLEEADSVVSLVCGINRIAWAHVDRDMRVLDWRRKECNSFMQGNYMASCYLDDVTAVVSCVPPADVYLVEKVSMSLQKASLFPVVAHLRTVEAMLFALLSAGRAPDDPPRVFNMTRTVVGRHFDLMVGDSRTSGARLVTAMMTESVTKATPRVRFPGELLLRYRGDFQMRSRNRGEELCDALLQAIAFYEMLTQ